LNVAEGTKDELLAEIEAFRAELRLRAEKHERAMKRSSALDVPSLDPSDLDSLQIKALISQRYEHARFENRLRAVEKRLAEIEARNA
jgi:hypothetical protein